jgi:hypothetical protein
MFDEQVSIKVGQEIKDKTWGVTEQFLQVHDIVIVNGRPKIERIDTDKVDGTVIAYVPVKDEPFFMAFYFDNKKDLNIRGIGTESKNQVYFRATSEQLTFLELTSMTILKHTDGWNKGDERKLGKGNYRFSSFEIEPNPEPDEFEDKLRKLLDLLETDKEGVKRLVDKANGGISVAMTFHDGNGMFGGPHLDKETVKSLGDLNLSVDFDLYADGNSFKEE